MAPRTISAREVLSDLKAGLSNEQLATKYRLSPKGTRSLFDKLLAAGLLSVQEHHGRIAAMSLSLDMAGNDGDRAISKPEIIKAKETRSAAPFAQSSENDPKSFHDESIPQAKSEELVEKGHQEGPSHVRTEFIDISQQGYNQWWRYLVSIIFLMGFPIVMWGMLTKILVPDARFDSATGNFIGIGPFQNYILMNLQFVIIFVAVFMVVRLEHKRPFLSLITKNRSIGWNKIWKSFGLFWVLISIEFVISYALDPMSFQLHFDLGRFLLFAPLVLILTPIQTTAEELLLRGYLLQMLALLTKRRAVLITASGVLFTLLHLANPEIAAGPVAMSLYFFAVGGFLALVTLKSDGLEAAIGIHAAINLFVAFVVQRTDSALKTAPIFLCSALEPGGLVAFIAIALVFYVLMFQPKWALQKLVPVRRILDRVVRIRSIATRS